MVLLFLIVFFQLNLIVEAYYIPNFIAKSNILVPITNNGSYDPCRYFQIFNTSLYRMGQSNIIQKWNLTTLNYLPQTIYETPTWTDHISNIGISPLYGDLTVALKGTKNFDILNASTLTKISSYTNNSFSPIYVSKVESTSNQFIYLSYSTTAVSVLTLIKKTFFLRKSIALPGITGLVNSTLSKNQQIILVWQIKSGIINILEYNATTDWNIIGRYFPENNSSAMNNIALSDNGTIAVFQYDSQAKLTVYDIATLSVIKQLSFTNTIINQVIFLDKDCHLIAVMTNYSTIQIYDTFTLTLQSSQNFSSLSNYSAIDFTTGLLYFCLSQNMQIFSTQCPNNSIRSNVTNQCVNSIVNSTKKVNSTNYISPGQEMTANATISGFKIITPVIQTIFNTLQLTPFAIFFLSFINYWNLCCLYSMLNLHAPSYLATIHQIIFDSIQSSLFQMLGYNPTFSSLDSISVQNPFSVDYQIMLDFLNANFQNFLTLAFVFIIICVILLVKKYLISKDSFVKKYLKFNICEVILGQFISFVPFCIIPFNFLSITYTNVDIKINAILQLLLLFLCLISPAVLLWAFKKYKNQKNTSQKSQNKKTINKKPTFGVHKQIRLFCLNLKVDQVDQLRFSVLSVTVPILIILPSCIPFFIINMFIYTRRVIDALKLKKYRINFVITSLYFPIYHCCYFMFYILEGHEILVHFTGVLCIIVLFIGGLHQIGNIIFLGTYQVIIQLIKICKKAKNKENQRQKQKDPQLQQKTKKSNIFNNRIENQFQVSQQLKLHDCPIVHNFKPIKKIRTDSQCLKQQMKITFAQQFEEQGADHKDLQAEDIVDFDLISKIERPKIIKTQKNSLKNSNSLVQDIFQTKEDSSIIQLNQKRKGVKTDINLKRD